MTSIQDFWDALVDASCANHRLFWCGVAAYADVCKTLMFANLPQSRAERAIESIESSHFGRQVVIRANFEPKD